MYSQRVTAFGFCLLIALAVAMPAWAANIKIQGPGGSAPPPPPDGDVLYDQYNNAAANSISSQNFVWRRFLATRGSPGVQTNDRLAGGQ